NAAPGLGVALALAVLLLHLLLRHAQGVAELALLEGEVDQGQAQAGQGDVADERHHDGDHHRDHPGDVLAAVVHQLGHDRRDGVALPVGTSWRRVSPRCSPRLTVPLASTVAARIEPHATSSGERATWPFWRASRFRFGVGASVLSCLLLISDQPKARTTLPPA